MSFPAMSNAINGVTNVTTGNPNTIRHTRASHGIGTNRTKMSIEHDRETAKTDLSRESTNALVNLNLVGWSVGLSFGWPDRR